MDEKNPKKKTINQEKGGANLAPKGIALSRLSLWKRRSGGHEPDLNKAWLYSLAAFGLVAILVIVFHVILYSRISRDEVFQGGERETPTVDTIDRTTLNETIKFFEERDRRFQQLQNSAPNTIDPGL